jgi:hypothetical protein
MRGAERALARLSSGERPCPPALDPATLAGGSVAGYRLTFGVGLPMNRPRAYAVAQAARVRRDGRVAEGGGLLNRYRTLKSYRGFESPSLRQPFEIKDKSATQALRV